MVRPERERRSCIDPLFFDPLFAICSSNLRLPQRFPYIRALIFPYIRAHRHLSLLSLPSPPTTCLTPARPPSPFPLLFMYSCTHTHTHTHTLGRAHAWIVFACVDLAHECACTCICKYTDVHAHTHHTRYLTVPSSPSSSPSSPCTPAADR